MKSIKLMLISLMVFCLGASAFAQDKITVKGIVLDDTAQPVIGAAVFQKGDNKAQG